MAYGDFKDLTRRTASDKILHDKAFNIAKIPKCDGHQHGLASLVYKFFNKKSSVMRGNKFAGSGIKNENISKNNYLKNCTNHSFKNLRKEKYTHLL